MEHQAKDVRIETPSGVVLFAIAGSDTFRE